MTGGFSNRPKILKGAFVEWGLSLPPQFVVFQFNPEQLQRNRSVTFNPPSSGVESTCANNQSTPGGGAIAVPPGGGKTLRDLHMENDDLKEISNLQQVEFAEETISFQVRLDASDRLNEGDPISALSGILPELSALEQMVRPKDDTLLGALTDLFGGGSGGHSFLDNEKPPIVLFIWGYTRVLPVNLESLSITETDFNTLLAPTRATVDVSMTVIEGRNTPYNYTNVLRGVMSALNLRNIPDLANVVVPG